jgi:hypothetical protein
MYGANKSEWTRKKSLVAGASRPDDNEGKRTNNDEDDGDDEKRGKTCMGRISANEEWEMVK